MILKNKIEKIKAREILDSRGNPTVEATVFLENGTFGIASAPSGASTGKYEAHELRDGDINRYSGKGVLRAVENANGLINDELRGIKCDIGLVDCRMIHLDDTENKSRLGANAMLAVSLAAAKAAANYYCMPLYRYIGGISGKTLPIPMMNILNGGAHAANSLDIQEFMIMPVKFGTFSEALRAGAEIHAALGRILKSDGHITTVGDEGGYAPNLSSVDEALDYIVQAISSAGYDTDTVKIALDVASSEWASGEKYILPKSGKIYSSSELIAEISRLCGKYPIISVEDGLGEDDDEGWREMTASLGTSMMLVGDDYFVTNPKKLESGIKRKCGNSILVKPNQIGTLTETIEVVRLAKENGYKTIVSHRSGETEDSTIADIAVGLNAGFIKTGAPTRSERCAKYNRLLKIESDLGCDGIYGIRNVK
ncbi:MAG: phosphopyruvate hydratase [Ruminococcaceae bacterium]|nr:phosphopyruvate hydratase [Oscillospiraceae bacterium]